MFPCYTNRATVTPHHSSTPKETYIPHKTHGEHGRRSCVSIYRPSVPALTASYSPPRSIVLPANRSSSTISLPVPSWRIAEIVQRALAVDKEISPYVHREFAIPPPSSSPRPVVVIYYKATTARMLRVSTNGIFESLGTVLRVCQELDVDVLEKELDG